MALNDNQRAGERDPVLDDLYRTGAAEEPPAHLDAAILAAARREVGAGPQPLVSGLRRWRIPVSLAAMLVLSVSLVTLVKEEGGDALQALPGAPPATTPAQPVQPASPAGTGEARPQAAAPDAEHASPRQDASPAAPSGQAADGRLAAGSGLTATQENASGAASEPAAKPSSQPFRDAPAMAERSVSAPLPAGSGPDQSRRAPAAAERRAAPMGAPAPAPEVAERTLSQARKETASAKDRTTPIWQGYDKEPPQKWLERIEELRRQQRLADADAMQAEFRRRFPGHPLPAGQP